MEYVELYNGIKMPAIGAGTFPLRRLELIKMFWNATKIGYTLFDSAAAYHNERAMGYAWKLSCKKREELFLISKLSNRQQKTGDVRRACFETMKKMQVKYLDMYLMHWPNPETYIDCWRQMESLYKEGIVRSIGVCNFHRHHLEELLKYSEIKPMVNEIEVHPLLSQTELIEYCNRKDIRVIAYSPLARMHEKLIGNNCLIEIAKKHKKSVVQIVLRWDLQKGLVTIPKSSSRERLRMNYNIFDFILSSEEINQIDQINENFRIRYDPDNCDFNRL